MFNIHAVASDGCVECISVGPVGLNVLLSLRGEV